MLKKNPNASPREQDSYLEGDILFQKPPSRETRSGILGRNYLWPNGEVYVKFSGNFGKRKIYTNI